MREVNLSLRGGGGGGGGGGCERDDKYNLGQLYPRLQFGTNFFSMNNH
jgi:hypothetical protein